MTRWIVVMIAMADWIAKANTKCLWKKVEVRHTKDGNGSGLFAMEDFVPGVIYLVLYCWF
jgi:hypothetical protein